MNHCEKKILFAVLKRQWKKERKSQDQINQERREIPLALVPFCVCVCVFVCVIFLIFLISVYVQLEIAPKESLWKNNSFGVKKRQWKKERKKEEPRSKQERYPFLYYPSLSLSLYMGCCESALGTHPEREHQHQQQQEQGLNPPLNTHPLSSAATTAAGGVPSFSEFSLSDLKAATNNFSPDYIVSESGERAPNLVYKGRLQNRRWIAVKKFTKLAWPDPKQFAVIVLFLLGYVRLV